MELILYSKIKINSISLITKTYNNKTLTYLSSHSLLRNTQNPFPLRIWPESTKTNLSPKESNKDHFSTPQMTSKILSIRITILQNKLYSLPLKLLQKTITTSILSTKIKITLTINLLMRIIITNHLIIYRISQEI